MENANTVSAAQQENVAPPLVPTPCSGGSYEGAECDEGDDANKVQESRYAKNRLLIARRAIYRVLHFKPTKSKLSKCTPLGR